MSFLPEGRVPYYDQYGAIRDMLQNHVTEIVTLLTTRLPENGSSSEELLRNKLRVLRSLQPLGKKQAVVGQYQAYNSEVQQELNKTKDHLSLTPTFAGRAPTASATASASVSPSNLVVVVFFFLLQPCWRTPTRPATKACPSS